MKTCSKCNASLPLSAFYRRSETRLRTDCIGCVKARSGSYKAKHLEQARARDQQRWEKGAVERQSQADARAKASITHKACGQCGVVKPVSEFYTKRHNCKACHRLNSIKSQAKYPEKRRVLDTLMRAAAQARKNLSSDDAVTRESAKAFLEARRRAKELRHQVSKHKQLARSSNKRAFFRSAGKISAEKIRARFEVFDGLCAYCGKPADTVDHVIAIARGGKNLPANIRPACKSCNSSKGAKKLSEWRQKAA